MARETEGTISRSRLHDAFTAPKLPRWPVIETLVEILASRARGTDPQRELDHFHRLWQQAATGEADSVPKPDAPGSAVGIQGGSPFLPASRRVEPREPEPEHESRVCLPVYLVLDTSASMEPNIPVLNEMLSQLVERCQESPVLAGMVLLSVVSFNSEAHLVLPLSLVSDIEAIPIFGALGATNVAEMFRMLRMQLALDFAARDKLRRWMRPVVFLITDGIPSDEGWEEAFADLIAPSNKFRPHVATFGMGEAGREVIAKVSTLAAYLVADGVETQGALPSVFSSVMSSIESSSSSGRLNLPLEVPGFRTVPLDVV
ncbi:vWA domain-containing protein [Streptomyces sp. NPDC002692]